MTTQEESKPLVSIIVPSFNQGRFIRETIDSILSQDYRPIEVLVFDGGSTDETVEVLKSYSGIAELSWWSEPDTGVADAVNNGLRQVRGEIVAIQSSDDLYVPGAISTVVAFMKANPEIDLAYGDVDYVDEHSILVYKEKLEPFDLKRYLGKYFYIPQPSAFFRAKVIRELGGWRDSVSYVADADFWLRIAVGHEVRKIDGILGQYRYHPDQRNTQRAKIYRDWETMIRDLVAANNLDPRTKRFARMGTYLTKHHYTPESDWVRRTRFVYGAFLSNPVAVLEPGFPRRELIIGREPIWKFLSRVKRMLGFAQRTGRIPNPLAHSDSCLAAKPTINDHSASGTKR